MQGLTFMGLEAEFSSLDWRCLETLVCKFHYYDIDRSGWFPGFFVWSDIFRNRFHFKTESAFREASGIAIQRDFDHRLAQRLFFLFEQGGQAYRSGGSFLRCLTRCSRPCFSR